MSDTDTPPASSPERSPEPTPPRDLSPSAAFIFRLLTEADGPLTSAELADRTGRPRRTVQDALATLRERGLVERRPDPTQPAGYRYTLA